MLAYKLSKDTRKRPLVVLESPLGNGQEIIPDDLRRLAVCLARIADEADKAEAAGIDMPYSSSVEY